MAIVGSAAYTFTPLSASAQSATRHHAARHHHPSHHHAGRHHHHRRHYAAPSVPKRLRVVHVTRSSFTVTARHTKVARKFRLYASTNHNHLYVKYIKGARRTRFSHRPMLTIRHLHYTTKPYWFRLEARNGPHRRFSADIGSVGLQPTVPTNLAVHSSVTGTSLTWNSGPATGYMVTEATDSAMTQNVKTYTIQHQDRQFSPPDLSPATPYYFQVQAMNELTTSPATSAVQGVDLTRQQPLRVMTYNLLELIRDGEGKGGTRIAPWSQRRDAQVRLIKATSPDVIAVQEGGSWVGPERGPRQVDDLVSHLGGGYSVATTEIPPSQPHYHRTGVYIVYKSSDYATDRAGGHWALGNSRWAAYQVLRNKTTGAKFLFVDPHLLVTGSGGTDSKRVAETRSMVAQAEAYDRQIGSPPIVYAGDFNSDAKDGAPNPPSDYMLSQGYDDAYDVAPARNHALYDSGNRYVRAAPKHDLRLDYIFTQPGVATKSWGMAMNLSHGKFVGVIPSDHNPVYANLQIPYLVGGGGGGGYY